MTLMFPKPTKQRRKRRKVEEDEGVFRDRKYLDWLRGEPCILTGFRANEYEAVDPAHMGTLGRGIKSPDNEALPIRHSLHALASQIGEVSMLRQYAPDDVIRAAFKALAREYHRNKYLAEKEGRQFQGFKPQRRT